MEGPQGYFLLAQFHYKILVLIMFLPPDFCRMKNSCKALSFIVLALSRAFRALLLLSSLYYLLNCLGTAGRAEHRGLLPSQGG